MRSVRCLAHDARAQGLGERELACLGPSPLASSALLPARCRHAAIAKYFGDAPPACTKGCDHCQNPAAVRKQLDALEHRGSWSKTCIRPSQGNGFDPELYEGGRRGYGGFSR